MIPIVWLAGTSGVGKSTVGWELQQTLEREGIGTAFVDADQLRNVAGVESTEDEFIADGLRAIEPGFRAAGATVLIVAGLLDDLQHLARVLPDVDRDDTLVVYLSADDAQVVSRVEQRRWNVELAPESVTYAQNFDTAWVDEVIDTTVLTAADVARQIAPRVRVGATDASSPAPADVVASAVIITGAGGVGLSTTGFMAFLQRAWAGQSVGYVDSHQVGFVGADPRSAAGAALRASNTTAVAAGMAARGVEHLVITADPATARELTTLIGEATVFWLDASDESIEARHRSRAEGGGPPIAGDHRFGLDEPAIRAAVDAAIVEARDDSLRPAGATVIATDGLVADQVAERINAAAS